MGLTVTGKLGRRNGVDVVGRVWGWCSGKRSSPWGRDGGRLMDCGVVCWRGWVMVEVNGVGYERG